MIFDFIVTKLEEITKMSTHFAETLATPYFGNTKFQHRTHGLDTKYPLLKEFSGLV